MRFGTRQSAPLLLAALLLGQNACVGPPRLSARQAAIGTPAAQIATESFAAVLDPAGGPPLGAAVATGPPGQVLTSAHVACAAMATRDLLIRLQRGDGATEAAAAILAVSDQFDLAVLGAPEGFLRGSVHAAERMPWMGDPVWAVGPEPLLPGRCCRPRSWFPVWATASPLVSRP